MSKYTISYAQNREDIIIDAFFDDKSTGFYVDVGANHPVEDSVTKLFYDKGWRGINIEPNQHLLKLLKADRPEDINVGVGVGDKETKAVFRDYEGASGLSTFSHDMQDQEDDSYKPFKQKFTDLELPITTLAKVLGAQDIPRIDFMKIDVEGFEYEVLAGNDWTKYKPELICIEANHIMKDWRPILASNEYQKFFNDGLNDYYALKDSSYLTTFSFPEKVFMRFPKIVPFLPHSDLHTVPDAFFEERDTDFPEPIPVKTKVKWSLVGLREAVLEGFTVAILYNKRKTMHERIGQVLNSGTRNTDFNSLTKRYGGAKLLVLRIANLSASILLRVGNKIMRLG